VAINKEHELIQKCIEGDGKAQKALYEKFASTMYGICIRYSSNTEEAKDIMQDGFIKVFTKLQQFEGSGSFEGWMKRIFINCALEFYRVNKVHMYHSGAEGAEDKLVDDHTLDKISQKEILQIMNNMAPGYRTVLNLYIVEGYSHAEIAEIMGISEGTSKSQLSRARVILQEEIKKLSRVKVIS